MLFTQRSFWYVLCQNFQDLPEARQGGKLDWSQSRPNIKDNEDGWMWLILSFLVSFICKVEEIMALTEFNFLYKDASKYAKARKLVVTCKILTCGFYSYWITCDVSSCDMEVLLFDHAMKDL